MWSLIKESWELVGSIVEWIDEIPLEIKYYDIKVSFLRIFDNFDFNNISNKIIEIFSKRTHYKWIKSIRHMSQYLG